MWQALTPTRIYLDDLREIWAIVARATEDVAAQTDRAAGFTDLTLLIEHIREEPPREVIIIGTRQARPSFACGSGQTKRASGIGMISLLTER